VSETRFHLWSQQAALYSALSFAFFIPISPALMNLSLLFTLLFTLLAGNLRQHLNNAWHHPVSRAALLLFLLFASGTLWSTVGFTEALKGLNKYNELWYIGLLMPLFTTRERQQLGINTFLLSMTLILLLVYALYFGAIPEIHIPLSADHTTTLSLHGGFRSDIITNILMSFAVFIFAQRALLSSTKGARWRYALLFLCSANYAIFISSGTTGQILTIGLLNLLLIQHFPGKILFVIPLLLLTIVGYGTLNPESSFQEAVDKLAGGIHHDGGSASQRREFAENSLLLIQESPWLGSGTGSFKQRYAALPQERIRSYRPGNPHNEYLATTIQLGLIGAIGLVALFAIQLQQSLQPDEDLERRYLAQGLVALIIVASLGNSMLMDSGEGHFWAFFSALLLFSRQEQRTSTPQHANP
jgi:O-antigen ligase